jgi:outer membrane murein-binding lipoprotein Lpp
VKPTAAETQHFEAFVRQIEMQVPDLKRQIAAAKSSDVSGFIATVKEIGASVSKLRAAQASLGVPACVGNI